MSPAPEALPRPLRPDEISPLVARTRGPVLMPEDPGFEEAARGWNGLAAGTPDAILVCSGTADVVAAVAFARSTGVPLAVRSGGHDFAGLSTPDGGLLVDLGEMRGIRVDPEGRTVRAQAGARWGDVDHETMLHGLATTGGTVSEVGVAGYTLGGGTGYLSRKHGLAIDNLVAAELVTSAGTVIQVTEPSHPDLFWLLRGGGGNAGIVTDFELRLHELPREILAGQVIHRFQDAREGFRFYREFMAKAPDGVQCYPFLLSLPPLDVFPRELHGRTVLSFVAAYAGPVEEGEKALAPLRRFGSPVLDAVQVQPYTQVQQTFDGGMPAGMRWLSRAHYLKGLPDEAIDLLLGYSRELPGTNSSVYLEPLGGAIARVDPGATPFPHRDAPFGLHVVGGWSDPAHDRALTAWVTELHGAMEPHSTGGVYVNLLGVGEGRERVPAAYGRNLDRLREIKARWDPDNLFRANHNLG